MSTRAAARKRTLNRILKDVFELEDDDLLVKAIEGQGFRSIDDLLALTTDNIDGLTAPDTSGIGRTQVPQYQKNLLKILKEWKFYLMSSGDVKKIDWDDLNLINSGSFDEFRAIDYDPDVSLRLNFAQMSMQAVRTTGSKTGSQSSQQLTSVQEFRKGIKRDKSHYKPLKDEKQWDDWKRKTEATCKAHRCEKVLDPSYVPSSPEEVSLFNEIQIFMYDVLLHIMRETTT